MSGFCYATFFYIFIFYHIYIMNDPNFHYKNPEDNVSYSLIQQSHSNNEFVNQHDKTINFLTQTLFSNQYPKQKQEYRYQDQHIYKQHQNCKIINGFKPNKNDQSESEINLLQDSQYWQQEKKISEFCLQQNRTQNKIQQIQAKNQQNQNCLEIQVKENVPFILFNQYQKQNLQNQKKEDFQNQHNQPSRLDFIKNLQQKLDKLHKRVKIKRNVSASFEEYKQNVQNDYQQFSVDQTFNNSTITQSDFFQSRFLDMNQLTDSFYKNKSLSRKQSQVQTDSENNLFKKLQKNQQKCFLIQIPIEIMVQKGLNKGSQTLNKGNNFQLQDFHHNENTHSHFFAQNDEIHSIINGLEFNQKKLDFIHESQKLNKKLSSIKESKINNSIASDSSSSYKLRKNSDIALSSLAYSSGIAESQLENNFLKLKQPQTFQKFEQLQDQSVLSNNQNQKSISFHRKIKEFRSQIDVDQNQQIISHLLTKITQNNQAQEIQRRLAQLLQQNTQLKQKYKQANAQIQFLSQKNMNFWQQKQSIQTEYLRARNQCQYYLQQIQYIKEEFSQKMALTKIQTRNHYQQIINQLQEQQAEYAQRIISLQEILQEKLESQKKIEQKVTERQMEIDNLQLQISQKQIQINCFEDKQKDLISIHTKKQLGLKEVIQKLQQENNELVNILKSYKIRQQSQGIFVLCAEAEQIQETIQNKEVLHHEQLEQVQTKYLNVIKKYENQIETLKEKVQKVKQNKSTSIRSDLNRSSSIYQTENNSKLKNRESIRSTRLTTMSTFKETIHCTSYQYNDSQQNEQSNQDSSMNISIENQLKVQETKVEKFAHFKNFKMKQVQSFQHEANQTQDAENQQENHFCLDFAQNTECKESNSKVSLKKFFQKISDQVQLELFLTKLIHQNEYLQDLIQKQRKQKITLTKQLKIFQKASFKYIEQLQQKQRVLLKDEELFQQITIELEKQYAINKKLKNKLIQKTQKQSNQCRSEQHTMTLSRSEYQKIIKENKSLKKYTKILQKQISEINLLDECQNHSVLISSLQNFIQQNLSNIKINQKKLVSCQLWSQQKQIQTQLFKKKMSKNNLVSNIIKIETEKVSTFDIFSKKIIKYITNQNLTLEKLIHYSISPEKLTNQCIKHLNVLKIDLSLKVIQFAQQQIKSNKKLPPIRPNKILLSRFLVNKNNLINVEMTIKKQIQSTTQQIQNEKQLTYAAPQILLGIGQSQQSYTWTVGIIIDQIFHKRPYYKKIQQIISHKENYVFEQHQYVPKLKQIIEAMVRKNNKNRISLKQAQRRIKEVTLE